MHAAQESPLKRKCFNPARMLNYNNTKKKQQQQWGDNIIL